MKGFTVSHESREILGFQINRRRRMLELTVNHLANLAGVRKEYIKALENGKLSVINPLVLNKLAEALGIHYLMLYMLAGYIDSCDITGFFLKGSNYMTFDERIEGRNFNE